ncbi:hypothetical protein PV327_001017 [Microctonus hyperodae]|uniref:Peptidase S1 domain-containing protein n=1 Tax=Microctonus hyperodae TaxID=165561 RepID=A0AA39L2Z6_MICHY|nr:hypothetical protein PV327_001017 [Microctonus hyperodae]
MHTVILFVSSVDKLTLGKIRMYGVWNLFLIYFTVYDAFAGSTGKQIDVTKHPSWNLLDHGKCGISFSDRIIGGNNAPMGVYPWIARIGYVNDGNLPNSVQNVSFRCGGTIINKYYILTAAHCVTVLPGRFKATMVRLGEHNTETNPDCENNYCANPVQDIDPVQIIVHKHYNTPLFKHDIALIRLSQPITFNDYVKPICLPHGALLTKNMVGEIAEAAGWGIVDLDNLKTSTVLQTIKLPVLETSVCEKVFLRHRALIDENQMCVGGKLGQDSCTGDSGGPLMKVDSVDGPPKYYLFGIVSFGVKNCGQTATPAVYTRITHYILWILENISP